MKLIIENWKKFMTEQEDDAEQTTPLGGRQFGGADVAGALARDFAKRHEIQSNDFIDNLAEALRLFDNKFSSNRTNSKLENAGEKLLRGFHYIMQMSAAAVGDENMSLMAIASPEFISSVLKVSGNKNGKLINGAEAFDLIIELYDEMRKSDGSTFITKTDAQKINNLADYFNHDVSNEEAERIAQSLNSRAEQGSDYVKGQAAQAEYEKKRKADLEAYSNASDEEKLVILAKKAKSFKDIERDIDKIKAASKYFFNDETSLNNVRNKLLTLMSKMVDDSPATDDAGETPDAEPAEEEGATKTTTGETIEGEKVSVGEDTYTVVKEEYPEVQEAYKQFKDNFLEVRLLRDQDKLIGNLRGALSRFLGLEGPDDAEVAIRSEADEKIDSDASPSVPAGAAAAMEKAASELGSKEPETSKEKEATNEIPKETVDKVFGVLKTDVSRLRRDLNDSLKVLEQYDQQASKGVYAAALVLKRLKRELTDVQDSNRKIIIDLTKLAPDYKFKLDEAKESREEKIQKVEAAYDDIVELMDSIIDSTLPDMEEKPKEKAADTETPSGNSPESQKGATNKGVLDPNFKTDLPPTPSTPTDYANQFEEQIYRKVLNLLKEEEEPTDDGEIESFVQIAAKALNAINGIKKYFRVTGTFNKPLPQVKKEFSSLIKGYKKTLDDLLVDMRQKRVTTDNIQKYIEMFTILTSKIVEYFGISPREPVVFKKPDGEVINIPSADSADTDSTAAVSKVGEDEEASSKDVTEFELDELRTFYNDNTKFYRVVKRLYDVLNSETIDTEQLKQVQEMIVDFKGFSLEEELGEEKIFQKLTKIRQGLLLMFQEADIVELVKLNGPKIRDVAKEFVNLMLLAQKMIIADDKKSKEEKVEIEPKIEAKKKTFIQKLIALFKGDKQEETLIDSGVKPETVKKIKAITADAVKEIKKDEAESSTDSTADEKNVDKSSKATEEPTDDKDVKEFEESKNLLERLIRQELKVLNGKKMVRN